MFIHLFRYKLKMLLRPSEELFWSLCFPLILGTLFFVAFGSFMENNESFNQIPVAIVEEKENKEFMAIMNDLSDGKEDALFDAKTCTKEEAISLLQKEEIDAIIMVGDSLKLEVAKSGINQSIVKSFLDQFNQVATTITELSKTNPEALPSAMATLLGEVNANTEITLSKHNNLNTMTWYFYALIAMACLYGCLFGLKSALATQANLTALAARRCVTPTNKLKLILADVCACILVHYMTVVILICYVIFVLKIDFGPHLPLIFVTGFVGTIIGTANGIFIGSIGKISAALKDAIVMSISMLYCFLGGLMVLNMKDIIEQHAPIINRLNPAALISDALFSLSIYDTYDRYILNMCILLVMAAVLCFASFLIVRREKYASI